MLFVPCRTYTGQVTITTLVGPDKDISKQNFQGKRVFLRAGAP